MLCRVFWDKAPLPVQGFGRIHGRGCSKAHQGSFSFLPIPFGAGAISGWGDAPTAGWQLAQAMLSLPSQFQANRGHMERAASLGSASHPLPVLPESPQGFLSSDRNRHRHRDLLAALSWFSRLRFHLVLSGESL